MQMRINFESEQNINLPIAYRHAVQSMIYRTLARCPEYSAALHNCGFSGDENEAFKLFTFSQFEGEYNVADKRIIFEKEMTLEIRCYDIFMCQLLLEGFSRGNKFNLLHNELTVACCRLENKIVFDDRVRVKMLSPVAVLSNTSDKHTVYYAPDEETFYEKLTYNAYRKWCTLFDEKDFDLKISPAEGTFRKLVTLFKGTYVNAWYGSFVLEGNPRVIDFLYNVGLGNKSSQGFGMFEIAE